MIVIPLIFEGEKVLQEKNVQKAGKFLAVVSVENNLDRVRNTEKWKLSTPYHAEKTPDALEIIQ